MTTSTRKKKPAPEPDTREDASGSRNALWATAAGIGVGSAAIVAALLYANRSRLLNGSGDTSDDDGLDSGVQAKDGPIPHTIVDTD